MTTTLPTALSEILAIARSAAAAGDTTRARQYFRNLTEIAPDLIDGWLGYAASTAVLAERRALFARALELDPAHPEARSGLAQADMLLAAGRLLLPSERAHSAPTLLSPAIPTALTSLAAAAPDDRPSLLAVNLAGLGLMALLTTIGIFTLTSFWGFMLAFLAGPAVSELMVRASRRLGAPRGGQRLQLAAGLGMILGGLGAMVLGGLLLQLLGLPLPAEAVAMARNSGVGTEPASVLLNNPGLLIFVSSAVAATVFRMR